VSSASPYYLHIRAYNGDNVPGSPVDFGPYYIDSTPPVTPVITDDGAYTTNRSNIRATWTASDPESSIINYQLAVGTTPGGSDLVAWRAWDKTNASVIIATQAYGATIYVSVNAQNGAQTWSGIGVSDGIRVAKIVGRVAAVKALTDGTVLKISGRMVSAVFGDCFYIQDLSLRSGIRADGVCPWPVGTKVNVGGVLSTTPDQERTISASEVTLSP
jgi:hypothetical protein